MGVLGKAVKSGIAMQVLNIVVRELRKPQNQRKIKELLGRLRTKVSTAR